MNFRILLALLLAPLLAHGQIVRNPSPTDLHSPGPIGDVTPSTVAATTLSASGQILGANGGAGAPPYAFTSSPSTGIYTPAPGYMIFSAGGVPALECGTDTGGYSWVRNILYIGSPADTILLRDAANTVAMRNGVNAQTLNLYGTYTDGSNKRTAGITMSTAGVLTISATGAGTGAAGNTINLNINGTIYYPHDTAGVLSWTTTP